MKISRNWLNDYVVSSCSDIELVDSFTQLGLECTVEPIIYEFNNVVVGNVLSCIKHPDADRLKVCKIDVGDEILDIVCGAPNIKNNIKVPVAKIGAIINSFKIKKTKIRNIESNGMVCSGKELSLNDDHEGIMILEDSLKIGENLKNALSLSDDSIFDFDLTPNRGDCFSHLGVARELAIIENKKIKLLKPKFLVSNFKTSDLIKINVKNSGICKRYACRIIKNIKVSESPSWLKNRLNKIGHPSINNIVDLSNYIMFDLGQPLHIFDYDKINGKKINVRLAKNKEKILCLNNESKILTKEDIVIADSKGPIAIAGIIGSLDSQVDANTKNILIESAVFDEISIRRSSKKHAYSKEASKRFERGIDKDNVVNVLDKYSENLLKITEGEISKDYINFVLDENKSNSIKFHLEKCNKFLGINLDSKMYKNIFSNLSIEYSFDNKIFLCEIPSYRNDITRDVDLYEEVARVLGYDNIPSDNSFKISNDCFIEDELLLENNIRSILSYNGFNEHMSNSLFSEVDINLNSNKKAIELMNPLNQDMKYLRNDLLPGLLKAISYNEKRNTEFLKIYEIGSVNHFNSNLYNKSKECRALGIIWTNNSTSHWKYPLNNDIYTIKGELNNLFNSLNFKSIQFIQNDKDNELLDVKINNKNIGYVCKLNTEVLKIYKIKNSVFYCNLSCDIINQIKSNKIKYSPISSYPSIVRDISISINKDVKNHDVINQIKINGGKYLRDVTLFDYYIKNDDDNKKSLAYSLHFCSNKFTLKDDDIDPIIDKVLLSLKNKLNAKQR